MSESPRITISIPSNGSLHTQMVVSLLGALPQLGIESDLFFPLSSAIPLNRNNSVEYAQNNHSTHLMFIDADMVFPSDAISKLLSRGKMIIGINSSYRELPARSTIKFMGKNGNIINGTSENIPDKPFKCFAVGTGFMLIDMKVFEKLDRPYFQTVETKGDFKDQITEDVYFCKKAHGSNIDVWCDPTIQIGHVGDFVYEMPA